MRALLFADVTIPDAVFAVGAAFVTAIILGLIGWALQLLVKLSTVVSNLERARDEHDRRIAELEGMSHGQVRQYDQ